MVGGEYAGLEILVLDDEPIVLKALKISLTRMGFSVETFEDPVSAIERIAEKRFDIVVTDVVMGDVDGLQVLEHVMQKSTDTKVIIITAFAMKEVAHKAMAAGAFGFVAKPFDAAEIRAIVSRAADDVRGTSRGK